MPADCDGLSRRRPGAVKSARCCDRPKGICRLVWNLKEKSVSPSCGWGREVVQAPDVDEARRLFEQDDFPIVISDWMMPMMDGLELIRRIQAQERTNFVYTILLTGRSDKRDIVVGMEAGADDFVSKPFDYDDFEKPSRISNA